jgi:Fe-S cluster assembly iron-binding protein IscA
VLTVTENAATVIRGLLTSAGETEHGGLRIGAKGDEAHLAVEIAPAPASGDAVIEDGGARVFLDAVAAPQLSRRELDAQISGDGVRFLLRDQS